MNRYVTVFLALPLISLAASCSTEAKLTYTALPQGGATGAGFPFVVPRTLIKVDSVVNKDAGTTKATFTMAPVAYDKDGKTQLPAFLATDSSSSGLSLTPTTVSSATYLDDLIISAIGTQVTDNRKDAIDAIIGIAALAGAFAAAPDCAKDPLTPFVIESLAEVAGKAPGNDCWGYSLKKADFQAAGMQSYPVSDLAKAEKVAWFPIAACAAYVVSAYRCGDKDCTTPIKGSETKASVNVSDGTRFRRVPLPSKGKITLHPDFCQADVTNDGAGVSDWTLLQQVVSDVKSAKSKK
jgi:hypothetical protein